MKPSTVLEEDKAKKSKVKKTLSKETLKWMTDCSIVIWSNSKLLEYMTMSQLDYLKLSSRHYYTYQKSAKPLNTEILEYLLPFRKMIKERHLEFKTKIVEKMPEKTSFCLDWRVYKSILYHILSNAIKFCNSKGKIGLEISYED